MNYHYDRYARRLIEACGYAYDVLRTDIALYRHAYTLFAYTEEQRPSYDADSYERIEAGHIETDWISHCWQTKWLYGHSGFEAIRWVGSDPWFNALSEYAVCRDFMEEGVFRGQAKAYLPRLPDVKSIEELKIWLAAAGK